MSFLFAGLGGRKKPTRVFREAERALWRAESDLKRSMDGLARQEKAKVVEIKRLLIAQQPEAAARSAREIVSGRRQINRLHGTLTIITQNRLMIIKQKSEVVLTEALRGTTLALRQCNRSINASHMQTILMQFEHDRDALEMKQEMIADFTEDVLDHDDEVSGGDDETLSSEILEKIRGEIGLTVNEQMSQAGAGLSGAPVLATSATLAAGARDTPARVVVGAPSIDPLDSHLPRAPASSKPTLGADFTIDDLTTRLNRLRGDDD